MLANTQCSASLSIIRKCNAYKSAKHYSNVKTHDIIDSYVKLTKHYKISRNKIVFHLVSPTFDLVNRNLIYMYTLINIIKFILINIMQIILIIMITKRNFNVRIFCGKVISLSILIALQ